MSCLSISATYWNSHHNETLDLLHTATDFFNSHIWLKLKQSLYHYSYSFFFTKNFNIENRNWQTSKCALKRSLNYIKCVERSALSGEFIPGAISGKPKAGIKIAARYMVQISQTMQCFSRFYRGFTGNEQDRDSFMVMADNSRYFP